MNSIILERRQIAEETTEVSFKRPKDYNFEAGQYAQVIIPKLLYLDARGQSRVFSIASSPNDKKRITIAFRNSSSGYKLTLAKAPLGQEIVIRGPFGGEFSLPKDISREVVFIAGGIGITPFLSMINFAAERNLSLPITLLYANRSEESSAYLEELSLAEKRNPNFTLIKHLGQLDKSLLQNGTPNPKQANWYVAGPPVMAARTQKLLDNLGVEKGRVRIERFSGY